MKEKKKIEILVMVIDRVYTSNPLMQIYRDKSMIDICTQERVSHEKVLFCFSLLLTLSI